MLIFLAVAISVDRPHLHDGAQTHAAQTWSRKEAHLSRTFMAKTCLSALRLTSLT